MERSTPQQMTFGDYCTQLLESKRKQEAVASNEVPSKIIKNQSISNDNPLSNEGQICTDMRDFKLVENRCYSDSQHVPSSTSYAAGSSLSATSFRPVSVFDDPVLKEELRKGSRHWNQEIVLHYTRIVMDGEIQSLQYSIDSCQDQVLLFKIIEQFLEKKTFVVNAAFTRKGSIFLQKMIKKIKKTAFAGILTEILATWFYDMMNHHFARLVVQKCFEVFGPGPNRVFYEQAIKYFLPLATHELGCFSLQACIDTIGGEERMIFLNRVKEYSLALSIDPHGNYVVQHVLGLRISSVNHEIMYCLLGHFVSISQTKEGSHVTEKLMECYDLGLMAVVKEILKTPDAAYLLARHPFGNYVIQKALVMTKNKVGCVNEYKSLVEALRPHFKELRHTVGKHVINHIRDEFVGLNKQQRLAY